MYNRFRPPRLSDGNLPMKKINSAGNEKINFSSYEKISIYKKEKKTKNTNPIKETNPFNLFLNNRQHDYFGDSPTNTFQKVDIDKGFFSFRAPQSKRIDDSKIETPKDNYKEQLKIRNSYMSDSSNDDSFELEFEEVKVYLI